MNIGRLPARIVSNPLFWCVIFFRIAAAGYILVDPLWGFIFTALFDTFDATIYIRLLRMSRRDYYRVDKPLDWLSYMMMYVVGQARGYGLLLLPFLLYRGIGQLAVLITGRRGLFIIFPNVYEVVFLWVIIAQRFGFDLQSTSYQLVLGGLFAVKLLQEFFLYSFWPSYLRRTGYHPPFLGFIGKRQKVVWE